MFDSHIHSDFSADSESLLDDICCWAIKKQLEGIVITDHLDLYYPDFDVKFNIDFDLYEKTLESFKSKYSDKLKVLTGIEVGYRTRAIGESNDIVKSHNFDFVICSVHVINEQDPYYGKYFEGKSQKEAYELYLDKVYRSILNQPDYDVIGHIGYIRRYGSFEERNLSFNSYSDILESILKEIVSRGKGIELNTSTFNGILNAPMPTKDILLKYKEFGGEIITIGSDSHVAERVGASFNKGIDLLKECGFKYITHFEKRKPVFERI